MNGRLARWLPGAALALLGLGLAAGPATAAEPALRVRRAEFGLFHPPASGKPAFQPTTVVPLVVDQAYGWRIAIEGARRPLKVRETLTLPAEPQTWGDPDPAPAPGLRRKLSADGRTATTELMLDAAAGPLTQAWSVSPGDPRGSYVLRVKVEDAPEQVFRFELK